MAFGRQIRDKVAARILNGLVHTFGGSSEAAMPLPTARLLAWQITQPSPAPSRSGLSHQLCFLPLPCPISANPQVVEAKEPKAMLGVEGEDARIDNRMIKDDREQEREGRSLFNRDVTDKLG